MKAVIVFFLVLGLSYFLGLYLKTPQSLDKSTVSLSDCDVSKNSCLVKQGDGNYKIQFIGKPSALTPFDILLTSNDLNIDSINLNFYMQDMPMGFNEYSLVDNDTSWGANVILPVCSLGDKKWLMHVNIKGDGFNNDMLFSFNQ